LFTDEQVVDVVSKVCFCKDKSAALTSDIELTVIPTDDTGVTAAAVAAADADNDDDDAVMNVVATCLLQDQTKTVREFNTPGQHQSQEFEVLDDADSESLSFCTCSSDMSEIRVDLQQAESAARISVNILEQSAFSHEEPLLSELESVPEMENALGNEVPDEFSVAECSGRPEASSLEDVCTFSEETAMPEIAELAPENVPEPAEIEVCLESAKLQEKAVTGCAEHLLETSAESVNDDVEGIPATEQVDSCNEILSEVVELVELKQLVTSDTATQDWSLESDDVDDLFEMAPEGTLTPVEIQSETVALESKSQPVSSSSDQLIPDVFGGVTEDISALEEENVNTPCEIESDTVVLDSKRLESSHTSGQELTVIDEEVQVKEMAQDFEEFTASPNEIASEFVVAETSGLKAVNTLHLESAAEPEHPTEDLSEHETMIATCDEIAEEFLSPSNIVVSLQNLVSDGVTEVNGQDEYVDIATVDEEQVAESEEIGSTLVETSFAPKEKCLTSEMVDETPIEGAAEDQTGVEADILAEGTTVDSELVTDETTKVQIQTYSSEQMSEVREDNLGDSVDELHDESVDGKTVEDQASETGSLRDLPQSCVAAVQESCLAEEFADLPDDVTLTSFANEDTSAVPDLSLLPVTTMSSTEFERTCSLPKVDQCTPEQQLAVNNYEESCSEVGDGDVIASEPVVAEVVVNLETAQITDEPEVYEMYVEEEEMVTVEEKITESILTTVYSSTEERRDERGVNVEGTPCDAIYAWDDLWHVGRSLILYEVVCVCAGELIILYNYAAVLIGHITGHVRLSLCLSVGPSRCLYKLLSRKQKGV